ncbi:MAG: efflux RND transporter periplasmic adaptor subunit [Gammaproteobacteria bacterium]|jgi:membrane fusion protein (multidrug efflux system)|nr:efflux RND transporter periplasmic adaptor subunit [Gammaproteobacteria bacterium]
MATRVDRLAPTALLATLLVAACGKTEPTPPAAGQPPAVTVAQVARQDVTPRSTFTGRIEAIDKVELRARVQGFLEQRLFEEGGDVKGGQLLFVIEKPRYEAAVEDANGAVLRAEGALKLANIEVDRFGELLGKKAVAQNDYDQRVAKQTEAQGVLQQAKAALEKAELELSYTDVKAPFAGSIGRANYSVGSYLGQTSGALATIVSQDPTYVVFPVSVRLLLDLRRKQVDMGEDPRAVKVKLRLSDGLMYGHVGRIDFVDVQVDPGTDTVIVRAELPNPDRILKDEALVTAVIETAKPEQALVVPQQAIQIDQGGTYVLVVGADDKVQVRRFKSGPSIDGVVPVKEGLAEGERVITEGVQKVRPGIVVAPTDAAPRSAGAAK